MLLRTHQFPKLAKLPVIYKRFLPSVIALDSLNSLCEDRANVNFYLCFKLKETGLQIGKALANTIWREASRTQD